jgi:NAD(P)-dependent dehydrogenase (short-subunit alcohol dehydrogenase family)
MSRVLVTGGSMGIGLAVARRLAAGRAELVLVARGSEALEAAAASLEGTGHRWYAMDVRDEQAWHRLPLADLGGLVCAAGILGPVGPLGTYSVEAFRETLDVNVVGTLLAVERCLPALRASGGSIVTFSGGGATGPLPRYDAYAASKAAVARLSENLAMTLAPIRVNCVAPGFVATRMHEATLAAGPEAAGSDYYERTRREIEQGGFPASEAAELVAFLLSGVPFSGKLISAQWDPWRDREFHERLAHDPDLATVRRIDGMLFESARVPR